MSSQFFPPASLDVLKQRGMLLQRLRGLFLRAGYWEVETPLLSKETCIDAWLEPFAVPLDPGETAYLQTSPEFAMKRLLCAGAEAIFQITRSFRKGELGPLHNPEFTMVEWYRVGDDHFAQMEVVERLVRELASCAAGQGWREPFPFAEPRFPRLSYESAFIEFAGTSALDASTRELVAVAAKRGLSLPPHIQEDRDGVLNLLLAEVVEPSLAGLGAVFLYDYPASQAALARVREDRPEVAERFELYLEGIEICNGYHELTDPVELRRRMQLQNGKRTAAGKPPLPVESGLLQAMRQGLPASSGVALGFDRLAMFCLGKSCIHDVMAFPFGR